MIGHACAIALVLFALGHHAGVGRIRNFRATNILADYDLCHRRKPMALGIFVLKYLLPIMTFAVNTSMMTEGCTDAIAQAWPIILRLLY